jgi:hypothetical protein
MPKIVLPAFIDNTPLESDAVYSRIYTPGGNSCEIINGHLDSDNLADDFSVNFHWIQSHAVSNGGMVATTGNTDFFGGTSNNIQGWFDGISSSPQSADDNAFIPIPGASVQFYLPYPAYVLLTWQVSWVSDANAALTSAIRLFVDGDKKSSAQIRRTRQTLFRATSTENAYLRDRYKSRYWCGHEFLKTLGKGYHSASLRLCANENIKQTRVRARSMKYIIFKRSDS